MRPRPCAPTAPRPQPAWRDPAAIHPGGQRGCSSSNDADSRGDDELLLVHILLLLPAVGALVQRDTAVPAHPGKPSATGTWSPPCHCCSCSPPTSMRTTTTATI